MIQKYSDADIRVMSKRDQAMPSGAFPILDKEDLDAAVSEFSKASGHPRSAAMNHIMRRAVALGLKDSLPVEWGINKSVRLAEEELVRKTRAAGVASLQKNATGTIISSSAIDNPLPI